jgi:type II secretory pathway component PulJ
MSGGARRGGYTLLELLAAVLLAGLLFPMVADLCRNQGRSIRDTRDRAAAVRELALAADTLARDLGRAESLAAVDGELRLDIWAAPTDAQTRTVAYGVDRDGRLCRRDVETGGVIPVAAGIVGFDVLPIDPQTARVELRCRQGGAERCLALLGSVP